MPVGRRVVVIGGGMTAIDVAVQAKLLGAELVTIVYRRGQEQMKASGYEQELAQTHGVLIRTWARPVALEAEAHGAASAWCSRRPATRAASSSARARPSGSRPTWFSPPSASS